MVHISFGSDRPARKATPKQTAIGLIIMGVIGLVIGVVFYFLSSAAATEWHRVMAASKEATAVVTDKDKATERREVRRTSSSGYSRTETRTETTYMVSLAWLDADGHGCWIDDREVSSDIYNRVTATNEVSTALGVNDDAQRTALQQVAARGGSSCVKVHYMPGAGGEFASDKVIIDGESPPNTLIGMIIALVGLAIGVGGFVWLRMQGNAPAPARRSRRRGRGRDDNDNDDQDGHDEDDGRDDRRV
ncbi:MAG: hypothetical protein AB7K09_13645 [Planctomycetota bacterium]